MPRFDIRSIDRPAAIVGVVLLLTAAVIAADSGQMTRQVMYGIGPSAFPKVVALFFAALGLAHFVVAFRQGLPKPDAIDWGALGWVCGALIALVAAVALDAGFILAATLLFAMTARGFGRRSLLADCAIGFAIAVLVFLLFNNLLSLTLPQGPLERLL